MSGGITLATVAGYASIASAVVGMAGTMGLFGGKKEGGGAQQPGRGDPMAEDNSANDAARQNAVARRRAIMAKNPRSLLASVAGEGDLAAAPIGGAAAVPKQTMGG